ncbi:MAG: VOC family protein [Actinomycetota bacterium]
MRADSVSHPQGPALASSTGMGPVHLSVSSARSSIEFYRQVVGLEVLNSAADHISLGAGERELIVLYPGADCPVPSGRTGLYHLALVLPSQRELARAIKRFAQIGYPNSPTDHVMTKSDYLWDPDGNGLELYAETPEDGTWFMTDEEFGARDASGRPRSGRDPIHLGQLFQELQPEDDIEAPLPAGTKMGHIHLHVRDVEEAVGFYRDIIGFELMGLSRRFRVAFVAAGGYHHHVGLNTWAGMDAPPPPASSCGLRHFTIEVPGGRDLLEVSQRLEGAGYPLLAQSEQTLFLADPSSNRLQVISRR